MALASSFWNKTGTDAGVRRRPRAVNIGPRTVTWATIANWYPTPGTTLDHLTVWAVLGLMRHVGEQVLAQL